MSAMLYNKMFKKLEAGILERIEREKAQEGGEVQQAPEEEEKIFNDEPIVGEDKQ